MRRTRPTLATAAVLLLAACSVRSAHELSWTGRPGASAREEITAALESTATGWNRGDLAAYLAVYTDSATEMLPTGPAGGRDAIERTMREGFWRAGRPTQQLRYEGLNVRMLGDANALLTGRYVLTGGGAPERSGWFTSVWTRTSAGWRMIHDHS